MLDVFMYDTVFASSRRSYPQLLRREKSSLVSPQKHEHPVAGSARERNCASSAVCTTAAGTPATAIINPSSLPQSDHNL